MKGKQLLQSRASVWLCFSTIIPAATMMHPAFASLLAIALVALLVFAVRFVAHLEGRAMADATEKE